MKQQNITDPKSQLNFLVQFKTFQRLGYFIPAHAVSPVIVNQIRRALSLPDNMKPRYRNKDTQRRHRNIIREYRDVVPIDKSIDEQIENMALISAQTMNDPADIINSVLEELASLRYELPSFGRLDRIVCRVRNAVNQGIFETIYKRLKNDRKIKRLKNSLEKEKTDNFTPYQRMKAQPKKATITNFKHPSSRPLILPNFHNPFPK